MQTTTFELERAGARLFCRAWLPEAPRATVQIQHGLGEHGARYAHFAGHLAGHGYAVYALDARGHGRTASDQAALGHYADADGWRQAIADMAALNAEIGRRHPALPRVLLGHSMGSLMAQSYVIEHGDSLDALILSGSSFESGPQLKIGRALVGVFARLKGPRHRSPVLDYLFVGNFRSSVAARRTDKDWLSRDPAVVDAYLADPLCGNACTAGLWRDVIEGLIHNSRPANLARVPKRLSVLMIVGGADPLSSGGRKVRALAEAYRRQGLTDVTVKTYPGARHEVLNETNKNEVYRDVTLWLEQRLGGSQAHRERLTTDRGRTHPAGGRATR